MARALRWIPGPGRRPPGHDADAAALRRLTAEVEDGLRAIDFDEVTLEDRLAFLEQAVVWQVRRALRAGRFDLALSLQRFGVRRLAEIERGRRGFHPHVIRGGSTAGLSAPRPRRAPG